ncbi:MAG: MMPL family transporter, partial [Clostridia bacterium]|nr:MMPL family transporter [Clostridia bacterium]
MIGKTVLKDAYDIVGDLNIAISYLDEAQVGEIVDSIQSDPTITSIYKPSKDSSGTTILAKAPVWLGTFRRLEGDPSLPYTQYLELIENVRKNYVRTTKLSDGTSVDTYIVSVYLKTAGSEDVSIEAVKRIEDIVKEKISSLKESGDIAPILSVDECYALGGQAQNARVLVDSAVNDMPIFVVIAVVAVFIILLFTTHSYFEPLIFLATLGVSILLNMGSNIIAGIPIGTISTITSSCATILQLALAMDYAIFLMHTYYEELKIKLNPRDAIISALPKTLKSIAASALTTIGGFVALFFMEFGMGYDLGFVLAKGVLLSLLTVIVLQPILILLFNKPIMKTQHRWIVEPRLKFVSKNITKKGVAIAVIALCAAVCLPCAYFQSKAPLSYISMSEYVPVEELSAPEYVLDGAYNQVILMVPYSESELSKQYELLDKLSAMGVGDDNVNQIDDIFSVTTLMNEKNLGRWLDKNSVYSNVVKGNFIKNYNGKTLILYNITMSGHPEDTQSYASVEMMRNIAAEVFGVSSSDIYVTGLVQGASDLSSVTPADFKLVNILSAVIIFIILLFTFRNVVTSVILLAVIEGGIFFNLALVYFTSVIAATYPAISTVFVSKINFMSYIIVSAIELGATVDYAILLTSKIEEEKAKGVAPITAIKNGIYRAVPSVTTSAAILIAVCLAVKFVTSNIIVSQITELIARGTLFSYILTFTLLPAILSMKERARAAIRKRKGIVDTYEPDLQIDYNMQAAMWK